MGYTCPSSISKADSTRGQQANPPSGLEHGKILKFDGVDLFQVDYSILLTIDILERRESGFQEVVSKESILVLFQLRYFKLPTEDTLCTK